MEEDPTTLEGLREPLTGGDAGGAASLRGSVGNASRDALDLDGDSCAAKAPPTQNSPARGPSVDDDALYAVLSRRRRRALRCTRWIYGLAAFLALAVGLPATVYSLASRDARAATYLLPVSAVFAGVSLPIAVFGIYSHINNYFQPVLQSYVTRILWMVPVYALCSFTELLLWRMVERGHRAYVPYTAVPGAIRDCYESYTVLNFFYFMVTFLEVFYGEAAEKVLLRGVHRDDDDDESVRHPCPPYRWVCSPWRLDSPEFLSQCRYGVLLITVA